MLFPCLLFVSGIFCLFFLNYIYYAFGTNTRKTVQLLKFFYKNMNFFFFLCFKRANLI
ncbi:hypothetical protein RUMGNA_03596 [Mediterraneibacter gnavus ATCC 29149]|uniref:Uncharacterized protein n=1 Tax=Mediterraneibacter gnavus (strain ATCC 29149 / DSM 114966 / JCM 6515 / VPI C7-9) TaxID=411470 RepID=A7B7N0_MEDG7|nr:hypothetical protein RUMGNA_03596 [Mediterraneibacter gnavus ATCC 29149]